LDNTCIIGWAAHEGKMTSSSFDCQTTSLWVSEGPNTQTERNGKEEEEEEEEEGTAFSSLPY
jgi:hypothetical protein